MKSAAVIVLSLVAFGSTSIRCNGEDDFEPPGAKEQAEVDAANKVLDGVYRDLIANTEDPKEQSGLREAQRAWIKWRDAEATYIARHGGAIGGSAMRVAYAEAQLRLINERIEMLKEYASQPPPD